MNALGAAAQQVSNLYHQQTPQRKMVIAGGAAVAVAALDYSSDGFLVNAGLTTIYGVASGALFHLGLGSAVDAAGLQAKIAKEEGDSSPLVKEQAQANVFSYASFSLGVLTGAATIRYLGRAFL